MYNVTNALSENNKDPFRSYRFKGVPALWGLNSKKMEKVPFGRSASSEKPSWTQY